MLAATGRRRRALTRRLAKAEGHSEAVDSSIECLICLASAFDVSKAKSKWFQCRAGHLLCETCCNTVSGTAPCSACNSPMGASLTTSMDSIRCRALEAVVQMLLLDGGDSRCGLSNVSGWVHRSRPDEVLPYPHGRHRCVDSGLGGRRRRRLHGTGATRSFSACT